jgi:acyl-CoA dehydrogenase
MTLEVAAGASADETLVVNGLLAFLNAEVVPLEERLHDVMHDPRQLWDENGREVAQVTAARRQVRMASAAVGYYAMFTPVSAGGSGLGARLSFLCWEALHHAHGPGERLVYNAIAHWASGPSSLWAHASPALQSSHRPRVLSGELLGCFGMSEPDAGSDAWRMQTRALKDGDVWRINGMKQWTSFAPTADFSLVFAVTDPEMVQARKGGVSCFFVPASAPGFSIDSVIRLYGEIGGREAIVSLTDVEVSDDFRLGEVNRGFQLAMEGATQGRFYNSARSVGLSRWALERSVEYARNREASGKPIGDHQAIQILLADSATDIYAVRAMGLECATKAERGEDIRRDAAMTKLFATNAANRVFDRAMQVHGGMGLTNELRLHEGWKTVRAIRIADGTDEILRRTIAKELLKGDVGF